MLSAPRRSKLMVLRLTTRRNITENNMFLLVNLIHNLTVRYVHNYSNCMFRVNTYASVTKVSIIKEDLMMMIMKENNGLERPSCIIVFSNEYYHRRS